MTKGRIIQAVLAVLCFSCVNTVWADDEEDRSERMGEKVFTAAIVRLADLTPAPTGFGTIGTDPLKKGQVEARGKRKVEVDIRGAMPGVTYAVQFCRLGQVPPACLNLGSLDTDNEGDGESRLAFSETGNIWAGVFILSRESNHHFGSGFRFEAEEHAAVLEIKGRISALSAATSSFKLANFPMEIFTDSSTRFEDAEDFSRLRIGDRVEIKASLRADGKLFATKVEVEDGEDD